MTAIKSRAKCSSNYRSRRFLLTRNEKDFFQVFRPLVGDRLVVFAKVRLADVLTCSASLWDQGPGRKISQKHLDFVVCDLASSRIVAAIELDDRSHARPERRERDAFLDRIFREAGLPLMRFKARRNYEADELKRFWLGRE